MVLTGGAGVLLYIAMALVVPWANTPAEKAAATGAPSTAEEFIRRAREGYYEGMKTFKDRRAFREWKRQLQAGDARAQARLQEGVPPECGAVAPGLAQLGSSTGSSAPTPTPAGSCLPILGVMSAVLTLLCLASIISLVLTGAVFGFFFPAGIHLWLGILILLVIFSILKLPLKAIRYSCYWHGGYGPGYYRPGLHLWNTIVWLAFLVFVLWLLNTHSEHAHSVIEHLRAAAHHVVDALRDWWNKPSPVALRASRLAPAPTPATRRNGRPHHAVHQRP